ncbi:MAG TPA: DUF4760 domain-containing protein [Thermoplasmata archaeon]|nr:DUF4760 domain-containing protein [Thermoplasmata archaeon]
MVTLSDIVTVLSASSSIAVILGAIFIVFQMRQNAKLIEATLREERSNVALSLLERITEESFPRRRKRMFDILQRFQATNWADAFESEEDLEVRNFAYLYELIGLMVENGLVDLELVLDTLQYLVVRDWQVFEPHAKFVTSKYEVPFNAWGRFEWLAARAKEHLEKEHLRTSAPRLRLPDD